MRKYYFQLVLFLKLISMAYFCTRFTYFSFKLANFLLSYFRFISYFDYSKKKKKNCPTPEKWNANIAIVSI